LRSTGASQATRSAQPRRRASAGIANACELGVTTRTPRTATTESDVFTRFDTLGRARSYLTPDLELVAVRGVRVVTPSSHAFAIPALARLLGWAERVACDAPVLRNLGGFLVLVARKRGPA